MTEAVPNEVWIFLLFLGIGSTAFGGAYSVWALIHRMFVQTGGNPFLAPLPPEFFHSFMEVGQLTPGPNINGTLLVGHHYGGYPGMAAALIGLLLPSVLAVVFLYRLNERHGPNRFLHFFKTGALAGVIGVLVVLLVQLGAKVPRVSPPQTAFFAAQTLLAFYLVRRKRSNAVLLAFLNGLAGWAFGHFLGISAGP